MKKTALISWFLLFALSSFGQKIRFTDSTNKWKWFQYNCGSVYPLGSAYTDSFGTDTFALGLTYKQLVHPYAPNTLIREDTVLKKIFAMALADTTEQLLYDYTLNVGDTFRSIYTVHHVISIDSVIINSVYHRVWYLQGDSIDPSLLAHVESYYVVDGVGCLNGPLFPLNPYGFDEDCKNLTCFSNRGITPLVSPTVDGYFDNASSCGLTFGLTVNNYANGRKKSVIMPNPVNETSKIVLPYNITSGSLIVVTDIGERILNMPFQNKEEISIGDKIKLPGIYYYRVSDIISNETFTGKFVVLK